MIVIPSMAVYIIQKLCRKRQIIFWKEWRYQEILKVQDRVDVSQHKNFMINCMVRIFLGEDQAVIRPAVGRLKVVKI